MSDEKDLIDEADVHRHITQTVGETAWKKFVEENGEVTQYSKTAVSSFMKRALGAIDAID